VSLLTELTELTDFDRSLAMTVNRREGDHLVCGEFASSSWPRFAIEFSTAAFAPAFPCSFLSALNLLNPLLTHPIHTTFLSHTYNRIKCHPVIYPSSSPSSSAKVPTEKTSLDKLFDKYSCDPSSSCMGMEGLSALADDLNMDETDLRVMVLAWKMGAGSSPGSTPGTITRKEFVEGLSSNGMKNLGDIKKHIPSLDPGFLLPTQFMSFYTFFFKFNLEGTHKTLENEFARDCLSCVLSGRRNEHLEQFTKFLASSDGMSRFERITLDQWTSFLSFSLINPRSCFGYDEIEANCAWPVLIDEYVDWVISETGKAN